MKTQDKQKQQSAQKEANQNFLDSLCENGAENIEQIDSNGSKDIVLAYYNYGIQFPLRGFSCSSQQVPEIKSKFKKYDLFASLNIKDVYGEVNLEKALRLHANSFKSTILLNNNGNFNSINLPFEAQLSSINDFIVDDYNNDGIKDILAIGNLYNAEVETPAVPPEYLSVLMSAISVQELPSHSSTESVK